MLGDMGNFDSRHETCDVFATTEPTEIMKNPLQNLLIFFALCLCVLCAWQWHVQAGLNEKVQKLTDTIQDKLEVIQNQQAAQRRSDEEIKRLDGIKLNLTETVKSNRTEIARLTKDLDKSNEEVEKGLKQIESYKSALQQANDNIKTQNEAIKTQNENIKTQNESLKKLSTEHSELVAKYNKVVSDFNDLAKKWNDAQAAAAAAATNPPSKK